MLKVEAAEEELKFAVRTTKTWTPTALTKPSLPSSSTRTITAAASTILG